jgi:hypothetical protein
MNNDFTLMLIRKAVTLAAGSLITHGYASAKDFDQQAIEMVSGALALIISIFWSHLNQKRITDEKTPV